MWGSEMNATTRAIINRLPDRPILSPVDIAAAYGMATTHTILADIKTGRLAAQYVGGRYIISMKAATDYISRNEYTPDEGALDRPGGTQLEFNI